MQPTTTMPESLTHQHILAAITAEVSVIGPRRLMTLLDAGCGEGRMLRFLSSQLPTKTPATDWEFAGFDVADSTSRRPGFPGSTAAYLRETVPLYDWAASIRVSRSNDAWPYDSGSFDFITSNQVLEHVVDAEHFIKETARVLAPGGRSINVFPLRNYNFEGHLNVPVVHKIRGQEQRAAWMRILQRTGIGAPKSHRGDDSYPTESAAYIQFATHYRSLAEFQRLAKTHGLEISYRYTSGLYAQKLRQILGQALLDTYQGSRNALTDWGAFVVARQLSSVTLIFERPAIDSRFGASG